MTPQLSAFPVAMQSIRMRSALLSLAVVVSGFDLQRWPCESGAECEIQFHESDAIASGNLNTSTIQAMAHEVPPGLTSLRLDLGSKMADAGLEAIAHVLPRGLTSFSLKLKPWFFGGVESITEAGLRAMVRELPAGLTSFELDDGNKKITDAGLEAIVSGLPKGLTSLSLRLCYTSVGDAGLGAMVHRLPAGLTSFELASGGTKKMTDAGLEALGQGLPKGLTSLRLKLSNTKLTDAGLEALVRELPEGLTSLFMNLRFLKITDAGLEASMHELPAGLTSFHLDLSYNKIITDAGIKAIMQGLPEGLTSLRLELGQTEIADAGLAAIARGLPEGLASLRLYLERTKITDAGIEAVAQGLPEGLTSLHLSLYDTKITDAGIEVLARGLPKSLEHIYLAAAPAMALSTLLVCRNLPRAIRSASVEFYSLNSVEETNSSVELALPHLVRIAKLPTPTCLHALLLAGAYDPCGKDAAGFTLRDYLSSSQYPERMTMVENLAPFYPLRCLARSAKFWNMSLLTLALALTFAVMPLPRARGGGNSRDSATSGARLLAMTATVSPLVAIIARVYRALEVTASLIVTTAAMLLVNPVVTVPLVGALFIAPWIIDHRRQALEAPMVLAFTAMPTQLIDARGWTRHESRKLAFSITRAAIFALLVASAYCGRLPPVMGHKSGSSAIELVRSNARDIVCSSGGSALNSIFHWQPWSFSGPGCSMDIRGCINASTHCKFRAGLLLAPIGTVDDGAVHDHGSRGIHGLLRPDGMNGKITLLGMENSIQGTIPQGPEIQLVSSHGYSLEICPGESVCLQAVPVRKLWSWLMWAATGVCASWLAAAVALLVATSLPPTWRRHLPRVSRGRVRTLAKQIANAGSAEAVGRLAGARGPVKPVKGYLIYMQLGFMALDMALDLNAIWTMLMALHTIWAGVLLMLATVSTVLEVRRGSLTHLRLAVAESVNRGFIVGDLQSIQDQEKGSEAFVSLCVTCYTLPFLIKSPKDAVLLPLSVVTSTVSLSAFLLEKIDMALSEDEGKEDESSEDSGQSEDESSEDDGKSSSEESSVEDQQKI